MLDVLIALIPAFIASVIIFGARSILVTGVCIVSCLLFEWGFTWIVKRPNTIRDFSAIITGVLLAFNLPVTIPIWQAVFGSAVAIVLVKQLFGGLGKNFANPAITARIVMFLAFSVSMTNWVSPLDGVSAATPLALIGRGDIEALPGIRDMILGIHGGCLGETSAITLAIGGAYLMIRRVISWHTPVTYVVVVVILSALMGQAPVYQMFAGGLFLGAIFMATDYVTTPQTNSGRLIFGVGAGVLTVVFRVYSSYPEGVSFAILLMNILTPYINRLTETKPLGGRKA